MHNVCAKYGVSCPMLPDHDSLMSDESLAQEVSHDTVAVEQATIALP